MRIFLEKGNKVRFNWRKDESYTSGIVAGVKYVINPDKKRADLEWVEINWADGKTTKAGFKWFIDNCTIKPNQKKFYRKT